jgi:hypothetical protein
MPRVQVASPPPRNAQDSWGQGPAGSVLRTFRAVEVFEVGNGLPL